MRVFLIREKTPAGGIRQYWKAERIALDEVGYGRRRRSAIRDLRPAEQQVPRGR